MALKAFVILTVLGALCPETTLGLGLRKHKDPKGAGTAEDNMGLACDECATHKDYLTKPDECACFATDIAGTFENDATKTSTKRTGSTGEGSGEGTHSFEDTSGG